ncbi:DNA repair protein REV1 isoform X2 [Tanacetum coccineum]
MYQTSLRKNPLGRQKQVQVVIRALPIINSSNNGHSTSSDPNFVETYLNVVLAVFNSDNPRGTSEISSANYPARDHGVRVGIFVRYAKALCPHLVIVPYNFGAYEETTSVGKSSNMLMARLATRSAKPDGQCYLPLEKACHVLHL